MAIREGRWDCPSCGQQGLLGRDQHCSQCGDPRPPDVRFYLPEDAPVVQEAPLLAKAAAGPDWLCEFCRSSNAGSDEKCSQCAAERGAAKARDIRTYAPDEVPRSGERPLPAPAFSRPAKPFPWKFAAAAGAGLLVLVTSCTAFLSWPRYRQVTLVDAPWRRSIEIEAYRTVAEEGWSVPADGRVLSQSQEIHHYDQVLDHYETRTRNVSEQVQTGTESYVSGQRDLGNGFFEDVYSERPIYETRTRTETYQEPIYRSVPVLGTKYRYELERWMRDRTAEAAGVTQSPHWPQLDLREQERAGARREEYKLRFRDDRRAVHELVFAEADWRSYQVGQSYRARFDAFGNLRHVAP